MRPRPITKLCGSLERRLTAYTIAASASGMGFVLCSQPAAAKVVYTKTNQELQLNTPLSLDLNHDGIVDFLLHFDASTYGRLTVFVQAERSNRVAGYCRHLSQSCWASAQLPDVRVGPNQRFGPYSLMLFANCSDPRVSSCFGGGAWNNVQNHYLGLQFTIRGKVHYGWARLNVSVNYGVTAVLTGYAYETVPNKPLVTGKTKGPSMVTPEPETLGHLARGVLTTGE